MRAERAILELGDPGFAPTVLRFATAFGLSPGMRFDLLVNEFTRDAVVSGRIVVYGEQFWRPYIHTTDIAEAILLTLRAPASAVGGRVFNAGSDDLNYQKKDIVAMICSEIPGTVVERVPQATDPRDYRVSFARVREQLGFVPRRTVLDGIREIAAAIRHGVFPDPLSTRHRNTR